MKYIGTIDEGEETLYVLQDYHDIYICNRTHLDFPVNLGYDAEDIDYDDVIDNLKINQRVELTEWYLVMKTKSFERVLLLWRMAKD